ncbi:EF-hand domain-containing protein [Streptomyces sp. 4N509B]|uniref:EF-hand domain-containing protein n=1 Tax=Streptomyces sp. 4N509B TaxID=3457413 RepID=UPI003FCF55CF
MTTALANDRLKKRFDKWDADGNGQLERSDLREEAARIAFSFGKPASAPEARALRDAFDGLFDHLAGEAGVGADGPIGESAFLRVAGDLISAESTFDRVLGPVVKGIVGLCDRNGDGLINAAEFEAWLAGVGVDREEARSAFAQVDTNGDGELSLDELLVAVRDFHFGRLEVELLG